MLFSKEMRRWLRALQLAKILFEDEGYHSLYLDGIENFIRRRTMYSPKIREDLIPKIYQVARAKRIRMTILVNQILENALNGKEAGPWTQESTSASSQKTSTGNTSPCARKNNALTSGPTQWPERPAVSSPERESFKEEDEEKSNKRRKEDHNEAARID